MAILALAQASRAGWQRISNRGKAANPPGVRAFFGGCFEEGTTFDRNRVKTVRNCLRRKYLLPVKKRTSRFRFVRLLDVRLTNLPDAVALHGTRGFCVETH